MNEIKIPQKNSQNTGTKPAFVIPKKIPVAPVKAAAITVPQKNPNPLKDPLSFHNPHAAKILEPSIPESAMPEKKAPISAENTKSFNPTPTMNIGMQPLVKTPSAASKPEPISIASASLETKPTTPRETNDTEMKSTREISDIPTLRTFKKDIGSTIRDQKTSLVRMVLEEQRSRAKREMDESPRSKKNLPLIFLSVFFILLTIGVIYFAFFRQDETTKTLLELKLVPLITTETMKEFSEGDVNGIDLVKGVKKEVTEASPKLDTIEYFLFTKIDEFQTSSGPVRQKRVMPARDFIQKTGLRIPNTLLHTLQDEFMLGIHTFNGNQPFFILKTDSYETAFSGMLEWERTMIRDISPVFGVLTKEDLSKRSWSDVVIKNKDTRILFDFNQVPLLMYMFKDQYTIIITTNEDTLLEISRRIDTAKKEQVKI